MLLVAAWAVMTAALGAANARGAFPGQNGKIAFVLSPSTGDDEIFTIDPSGQNAAPVTDNAVFDDDPAFSPDGERIAFTRGAGSGTEIAVMDANGQNPELLAQQFASEPAFSPDGQRIVFSRYGTDGEIVVMDADGQNQVALTDNTVEDKQPVFSPDGQRIVFSRRDGSDDEIFMMNANGQNQVALTDSPANDILPDFSPDGQRIVFTRNAGFNAAEIFVMDADGQNQTRLTNNAVNDSDPAFSPDGQRIVFRRTSPLDYYELFIMEPNGQNPTLLAGAPGSYYDSPDWQPLNPPALDLSGPAKQKSARFVTVTVSSQNEDATAALGGTVQAPKTKASARASKKKSFQLTPQTVELAPGQPVTVNLEVPKKARKLLKKGFAAGKKGEAEVTATATDDLGASNQDSQQVKLKKKSKK